MTVKRSFLAFQREKIRLRAEFRLLMARKIKDFVIQVEAEKIRHDWKVAVRYDLKHGYFHCDLINPDGRKIDQRKILVKGLNNAVSAAMDDLSQNLESYLKKAEWSEMVDVSFLSGVRKDLKSAEEFLLNLIDHPEKIRDIPDKFLLLRDAGYSRD